MFLLRHRTEWAKDKTNGSVAGREVFSRPLSRLQTLKMWLLEVLWAMWVQKMQRRHKQGRNRWQTAWTMSRASLYVPFSGSERTLVEISKTPQDGSPNVAALGRYPGSCKDGTGAGEDTRSPQDGGIQVAAVGRYSGRLRGSVEVAAGGKGRGRFRMMVPSQVVRGDRYPGRCREGEGGIQAAVRMAVSRSPRNGGLRIAAEWRSPGCRRMEVSGSRPNGGLQVTAGWRSPGRRRMEVSRSRLNGGLQVAAGLQIIVGRWRFL